MIARRLLIRGHVQGVCFRDWTVATARAAGLSGWVRNRHDDSVEIVIEGEAAAVDGFVRACHVGPPAARVSGVDQHAIAPEGLRGFTRYPTA